MYMHLERIKDVCAMSLGVVKNSLDTRRVKSNLIFWQNLCLYEIETNQMFCKEKFSLFD